MRIHIRPRGYEVDPHKAEKAFLDFMVAMGLDMTSQHLIDTPRRFTAMMSELFFDEPWNFTTFENDGGADSGIVLEQDIPLTSLCAHHFALFSGVAHVAYVPKTKLVGLSKLARAVQSFAKGPNVQEDIGRNVADFLWEKLDPIGVAVIIEAQHTCMTHRGVRAHGTVTKTSVLRGCFYDDPSARQELMELLALRRK